MTPAASAGLTGGQGWHSGSVREKGRAPWYLSWRKDGQVSDSRIRRTPVWMNA